MEGGSSPLYRFTVSNSTTGDVELVEAAACRGTELATRDSRDARIQEKDQIIAEMNGFDDGRIVSEILVWKTRRQAGVDKRSSDVENCADMIVRCLPRRLHSLRDRFQWYVS